MQQEKAHFPRPDGLTRQLADPPRVTETRYDDVSRPGGLRHDEAQPVPARLPEDQLRDRQAPGANPRAGQRLEDQPSRLTGIGHPQVH